MDEKIASTSVAGGTQSEPKPAVAAVAVAAGPQSSTPVVQSAVATAKPPAAFGGHRGGGKKRADGLVAGSPEAEKVDAENDAFRNWIKRSDKSNPVEWESDFNRRLQVIHPAHRHKYAEKFTTVKTALATLPPPLPGLKAPSANAAASLAAGQPAVPGAVAGPASGATGAPSLTFVAWTARMLERPVKLLTKICDRVRVGSLMARVRKLGLPKEVQDEAEKRMRYKDEQIADFNAALSNCVVIELNKRQVSGAEHSHLLELGFSFGELVSCHMDTVDWLEKQILAKAEAEQKTAAVNN
jgi:hypothetical protein